MNKKEIIEQSIEEKVAQNIIGECSIDEEWGKASTVDKEHWLERARHLLDLIKENGYVQLDTDQHWEFEQSAAELVRAGWRKIKK